MVRFTDEPESGNQINMSYCEEHAGEVWTPFIWPVGPAAVGGMYHHMTRRGRTTAGEARPKEMGVKVHFISLLGKQSTFPSSSLPDIMLLCGQFWLFSFKKAQNAVNMQIKQVPWFFPGLSTHSQHYVWLDSNLSLVKWAWPCRWLIGWTKLRTAKARSPTHSTFDLTYWCYGYTRKPGESHNVVVLGFLAA